MDLDMLQATEVKKLVSLLEAPEDLQAPLETLGDELRRYEDVLGLSSPPFDRRIVAVKIHDPIDMRPSALRYRELATIPDPGEREKQEKALLKKHANQLQALVQHGIDELVTAHQAFPQIGVHT
jgi:hypothetical protein